MKSIALNPFRPTRWEHHSDGRPLIWFTDTAEALTVSKSTYVYGSRGSGKTTLLKGICWEDLVFNESLRLQKSLADFTHIGIYIRFPDHISASMSFSDWADIFPNTPDPSYQFYRFFSLAVELICADRALSACHELRILEFMSISPKHELRIVEEFISEYPELGGKSEKPRTFLELARVCRRVVRSMNEACGRGTVREIVDCLPVREPYQLLAFLLEPTSKAARVRTALGDRAIGFKFCFDDCEVLNSVQRKSLNSLVRLSRSPVSWVISSVGGKYDDSDTFIESQPLTDADRRVVSLDDRPGPDFRQLCQSVVSLRLLFSMPETKRTEIAPEEIASYFQLEQRLGRRDINDTIALIIKRSTRPAAKQIRNAAERLLVALRTSGRPIAKRYDARGRRIPYYEAYVLLHWQGRENAFQTSFTDEDIQLLPRYAPRFGEASFDAWLRRKQRAALLHLSSALGFRRLPLAGENIVVSLADGSIRDFLEIMGEIFETYVTTQGWEQQDPTNLERFASSRTKIAGNVQTTGIYRASEAYVEGISHRSEIDADVISRLIAGLGYYTSLLQASAADPRTLAYPERGVFFVDYSTSDRPATSIAETRFVEAALRQAELAGYLRSVEFRRTTHLSPANGASRTIAFRLHRRFAPYFRFSFRGAYEPVTMDPRDLVTLCRESPSLKPQVWAENLARTTRTPDDSQFMLPLMELTEDE